MNNNRVIYQIILGAKYQLTSVFFVYHCRSAMLSVQILSLMYSNLLCFPNTDHTATSHDGTFRELN